MVVGKIADGRDKDYFQISKPLNYRAVVQIRIENQSTTLQPGINVFDSDKSRLGGDYHGTPGANFDYSFSVQPDTVYFVQMYGHGASAGRYCLMVTPLEKNLPYGPGNNFQHAASTDIRNAI